MTETHSEWRRKNFKALVARFEPTREYERRLLLVASMGGFGLPLAPVNPWLNLLEVCGFALSVGFIGPTDLQDYWRELSDIDTPGPLDSLSDEKSDRPFLLLGAEVISSAMLTAGESLVIHGVDTPFRRFATFADMHQHFREMLHDILYGFVHQDYIVRELRRSPGLATQWAGDEPKYAKTCVQAFRGLASLVTYIDRVASLFVDQRAFREGLRIVYRPWIENLDERVVDAVVLIMSGRQNQDTGSAGRVLGAQATLEGFKFMVSRSTVDVLTLRPDE